MAIAPGDDQSGLARQGLVEDLAAGRLVAGTDDDRFSGNLMPGEVADDLRQIAIRVLVLVGRTDAVERDRGGVPQQGDGSGQRAARLATILPRYQGGGAKGRADERRRRDEDGASAAHQYVRDVRGVVGGAAVPPAEDHEVGGPGRPRTEVSRIADPAPPFGLDVAAGGDLRKSKPGPLNVRLGHVPIEGQQLAQQCAARQGIIQRRRDRARGQTDEHCVEGPGEVTGEFEPAVAFLPLFNGDKQAGVGHGALLDDGMPHARLARLDPDQNGRAMQQASSEKS